MPVKHVKKVLIFWGLGDFESARKVWWFLQDERIQKHTQFEVKSNGTRTEVSISDESLGDQDAFIAFLNAAFDDKFKVASTSSEPTWIDNALAHMSPMSSP